MKSITTKCTFVYIDNDYQYFDYRVPAPLYLQRISTLKVIYLKYIHSLSIGHKTKGLCFMYVCMV